MTKGYSGEACSDAIRNALSPGEAVSFPQLFERIKKQGAWKDNTIWRHLMSCVVNLPPARHEWPSTHPFLFLHADGKYELFNPNKHPVDQYKG